MSNMKDRATGKLEEIGGKIQQRVGEAIGDEEMEAEGAAHRLKGEAKQEVAKAAERVKGTVESVVGAVKAGAARLVGNESLEAEGELDQAKGDARKALNE